MRDWILKIHLYGGLLCSGYLIILAVSSLNYNHKFGEPGTEKVTWERALRIEDGEKNQAVAERVRDELGLMGWIISWEVRREENGNLRFGIARPGKRYRIRVLFDQDRITVEETRSGFWQVTNNLHALTVTAGIGFCDDLGHFGRGLRLDGLVFSRVGRVFVGDLKARARDWVTVHSFWSII